MAHQLICNPALGQTTVVGGEADADFTVWLDAENVDDAWEVAIWHDSNAEREWTSLELSLRREQHITFMNRFEDPATSGRRPQEFFGTLTRPTASLRPVHFTVKFRKKHQAWQWINDRSPQEDGEICFQTLDRIPGDLKAHLQYSADEVLVNCLTNSTYTETQLWSITASVSPARGGCSTFRTIELRLPSTAMRWFSLVRISRPWLAPRQGKGHFLLSEEAVFASFLRYDGLNLTLLAISMDEVLTVFNSNDLGSVLAVARNDGLTQREITIVAAVSTIFENGNAAIMQYAREVVGKTIPALSEEQETTIDSESKIAGTNEMQEWQDSFTYCTWNGLGQQLNDDIIMNALKVLAEHGIKITNLIIDDGWQSLDDNGTSDFDRRWMHFDADGSKFRNGLKDTISTIRKSFSWIEHIAVWHGIFGYWGGISPSGDIYKHYKTLEARKQQSGLLSGGTMIVVDPEDVFKLYNDFYGFLYDAGVNSVKADTQFFLDQLDDAIHRRTLIKICQDAWTRASVKYFGLRAISCMSQIPQILFYSQLATNKPRFTVRNSDYFFPDDPSSHTWHIFCNAHNSVLTQHLNVIPDWDMFQTNHAYSAFHAAARCVSGGPICITDEPGKHNIDLIDQMTAKAPVRRIILRPEIGKSTQIYMSHKERAFCKIATYSGPKGNGSSILGVFNVGESSLSELVALKDFRNILPYQAYVVRAHTSGKISSTMRLEDDPALMLLHLEYWGYEILTAHKLQSFALASSNVAHCTDVAVLGLLHKMTGAAAIRSIYIKLEDNLTTLRMKISLKALGVLGIYVSDLLERSVPEDVMLNGKPFSRDLVRVARKGQILEVDLEGAWKEVESEVEWNSGIAIELTLK